MTIREKVVSEINVLNEAQLEKVADYLRFLKLRRSGEDENFRNGSIFDLGENPVMCDAPNASENLDEYLY